MTSEREPVIKPLPNLIERMKAHDAGVQRSPREPDIKFNSNFESGNLESAVQV
jgi:hypothetical protein